MLYLNNKKKSLKGLTNKTLKTLVSKQQLRREKKISRADGFSADKCYPRAIDYLIRMKWSRNAIDSGINNAST